jgi:hypothetical protein
MNTPNWNSISQLPSAQSFPFLHFAKGANKNTHIPKAFLYFTLQGSSRKQTHTPKAFLSFTLQWSKKKTHTHTHTQSFPFLHFAIEIKKERSTPKAFLHFASKPIKHMLSLVTCLSQINHEVPKRKERHDPNHGFCIPIYIGPLSSLISAPFPSPWSAPSWPASPPPHLSMCQTKRGLCILRVGAPRKKAARKKGGLSTANMRQIAKRRERECVCVSLICINSR